LPQPHPAASLAAEQWTAASAKEVYRLGAAHAARAKGFLVLDGFVTDHYAILNLETSLLAGLLPFEDHPGRKMAIHKRRADLLGVPLAQLIESRRSPEARTGEARLP